MSHDSAAILHPHVQTLQGLRRVALKLESLVKKSALQNVLRPKPRQLKFNGSRAPMVSDRRCYEDLLRWVALHCFIHSCSVFC